MICVERVERHTSVSGVRGPVFDGRRGRAKAAARMAILSFDRRVRPGSHAHRAVGTCTRPEIVCCVGGASGGRRRARGQGGRSKDGPCSCDLAGVRAWASTLRARGVRRSIRYALLRTSLPVYDHLTTRPDPLPIGRRCGRGVAPGGANVKPNRGAVLATTTYERRVMGDAVCRLRKRARRRAQVVAQGDPRDPLVYIRIGRSRTEKLVRNRSAVRRPLRQSRPEASPAPRASPPSAAQWPGRRRARARMPYAPPCHHTRSHTHCREPY